MLIGVLSFVIPTSPWFLFLFVSSTLPASSSLTPPLTAWLSSFPTVTELFFAFRFSSFTSLAEASFPAL